MASVPTCALPVLSVICLWLLCRLLHFRVGGWGCVSTWKPSLLRGSLPIFCEILFKGVSDFSLSLVLLVSDGRLPLGLWWAALPAVLKW